MNVADLVNLYDYQYWANAKVFAAASKLTDSEFVRDISGSYGSVRNTLVHALSAEAGWLDRAGGPKRGPKLVAADFPTLEAVTTRWTAAERQMRAFLAGLTDLDLLRRMEFVIGQGGSPQAMSIGEMLHHAALHNVHHRGQVALLLRTLGHVPGDWDIFFYYLERSEASAAPAFS